MWANLEIGHPQGKDMKEQVLKSVSGSPQLREPSVQGALRNSSGSKPSGIPQEIPVEKAASWRTYHSYFCNIQGFHSFDNGAIHLALMKWFIGKVKVWIF